MAVGDIEPHDLPKILWREFRVAILCGGTLALCNFAKLIFLDGILPPGRSGRLPDTALHGHPLPADRRSAAGRCRETQDGPRRHGIAAHHHHCRYHDAARLLQHRTDAAENLILDTVFNIVGCTTPRVWYNFLEKKPSLRGCARRRVSGATAEGGS